MRVIKFNEIINMNYTDLEYELFSRQFILKEYSEKVISKLNSKKIAIIGLGGIGCPLSQYLISSGFKNLSIFDGDIIEKSNLNRQMLYSFDEIGKSKAVIAKYKLQQTNPESKIVSFSKNINIHNLNLLKNYSIIIDTTDNWETTKIINKYCVENSISFIFSSAVAHDIQVGLFPNKIKNHTCLNCLFPNKVDADIPRCETIGISSITAGIAGLFTAQKTINYLLNFNDESNILTLYNTFEGQIHKINIKNNKDCSLNKC